MPAQLSVNLNAVAMLRNRRDLPWPSVTALGRIALEAGAHGLTVHPRPDQRHARYDDVPALKAVVTTELNIEGYPSEDFLRVVLEAQPDQVTLVPDEPGQLTSDHGWDTVARAGELRDIVGRLQERGIRTSLFVDPDDRMLEGAAGVGTDRIEFYTGPYAENFARDRHAAVAPFAAASRRAAALGLGINAGHDLNLDNLAFFAESLPDLQEVSIGHALITDALYYGLSNTIQQYLSKLR